MANQTVTTDTDMESVIALGLLDGENITINSGAKLTVTQKPSKLIGDITINDGELFIDGINITSGNSINFIGEGGDATYDQRVIVNGLGKLHVDGDWYNIGTTDGTNSQVVDLSSATGSDLWDGDNHISALPMIQIETGRRINFDNPSADATDTLVAGDWVYKSTDRTVMGKIKEVTDTYLIVWYLTGTLADDDEIVVRKIVENNGPDLQEAWTADVNDASGDIKESGVYQEFGNSRVNNTSYISGYSHGIGGFVFDHAWGATSITLGSAAGSLGGFVPPSGCTIRAPNVMFSSSGTTDYAAGNCTSDANDANLWQLECSAGGTIDLSVCNICNAYMRGSQAFSYDAEYTGSSRPIGSSVAGTKTTFNHCVATNRPEQVADSYNSKTMFGCVDNVNGTEITFCLVVESIISRMYIGAITSSEVTVSDCIHTSSGAGYLVTYDNVHYAFRICKNVVFNNNVGIGSSSAQETSLVEFESVQNFEANLMLISSTQDGSQQADEKNAISLVICNTGKIVGIELIKQTNGFGLPGNNLINCSDGQNLKFRCMGMIDDKVPFGSTDAEYGIRLVGLTSDINIARMWKDCTGTITEELVVTPTTCKNLTVVNCSGKYASEVQASGGDNINFKGLHGGSGSINSTTGVEVDLPATYGSHWHDIFRSDTTGMLFLLFAPKTTQTAAVYSVLAGSPKFDKGGALNLASGDSIEFEMQYFALGHTAFTGSVTLGKSSVTDGTDEWGANVSVEFQYDTGAGYNGTWLNLKTASNLTGISDTTDGVKIKVKITASADATGLDSLAIHTTTTLAAQSANLYPIDQVEFTLTINSIISGSEVRIYDDEISGNSLGTELAGTETLGGTTYQYTFDDPGNDVVIQIMADGYEEWIYDLTLPSNDITVKALQLVDFND